MVNIIIIICAFVLLAFLYAKFADGLFGLFAKIKYSHWNKISAEITEIELSKKIGTRGPCTALFQPNIFDVSYKYVYNGKEYQGQDIIDFKPKDNKLNLYVSPQSPEQSRAYR